MSRLASSGSAKRIPAKQLQLISKQFQEDFY